MKIHGVSIKPPKARTVVFPRTDSDDIVITVGPVLDYSEFEAICPEPKPKVRRFPGKSGKAPESATDDPRFVAKVAERAKYQTYWMLIQSLSYTEGLEWEIVDLEKPETWLKFEEELRASGFSMGEISRIMGEINIVCGLDQDKIDEATAAFLASEEEPQNNESSPSEEQQSTPPGEPASV